MEKVKIYFGSPLFSEMEKDYNAKLAKIIRERFEDIEMYVPQENEAINDKSGYADSLMIAEADTKELLSSDILIAIMDGQVMDVGLASEIGVAYQAGIPIIGLYTDPRQGVFGNKKKLDALDEIAESQFSYINLYTVGLVKKNGRVCGEMEEFLDALDFQISKIKFKKTINDHTKETFEYNWNKETKYFLYSVKAVSDRKLYFVLSVTKGENFEDKLNTFLRKSEQMGYRSVDVLCEILAKDGKDYTDKVMMFTNNFNTGEI